MLTFELKFTKEQVDEQIKEYGNREFKSEEEILEYIQKHPTERNRIIGHISKENIKMLYNLDIGKLCVVSLNRNFVLCNKYGYLIG